MPQQSSPSSTRKARRKAQPMTESRLLSAIDYRESRSEAGDLFEEEQRKALRYYFGEPIGGEDPDRSQIVMREVYSVIEWIKPMLMKVFFGSKRVLQFTPNSGEDVAQAEQETDYVNHIVTSKNDGFLLFMTWFNDALLLKNGYTLAYWDERVDVTESTYEDVTEDVLSLLIGEKDIEILEAEKTGFDEELATVLYKVRLRESATKGQVKIRAIPPESVRVEGRHDSVSLKDAKYVRYSETMTISELREQGFEVDDDVSDDTEDDKRNDLDLIRRQDTHRWEDWGADRDDPDPASREVEVQTCWIRVDFDGDGVSELRRVIRVGKEILYNETDDAIGLVSLTPTVISHRHHGMSIADAVMDIQEVKTMLVRGYIDNIFLANNGRYFVDDARVNLDDMLVSRPGGIVRVRGGVSNAMQPFQHPVLGSTVVQAIEYMDNVLENRTGASPRVLQGQTFDGNSINKTATGINQIMSSVMARIELIARIFAETGVQDLYRIVHKLSQQHARQKDIFKLRDKFVEVDPRSWETREAMTVDAGLGTGNIQEQIQALQMLVQAQMGMVQMGLATPANVYNALAKLTELMGFKDVDSFWQRPQQGAMPPQPGQAEAQAAQQEAAMKAQAEQAKLGLDAADRKVRAQIEMRKLDIAQQEAAAKNDLEASKSYTENLLKLVMAQMQSDDGKVTAGLELSDDVKSDKQVAEENEMKQMMQALLAKSGETKPRRVRHVYDDAGRIVESIAE